MELITGLFAVKKVVLQGIHEHNVYRPIYAPTWVIGPGKTDTRNATETAKTPKTKTATRKT